MFYLWGGGGLTCENPTGLFGNVLYAWKSDKLVRRSSIDGKKINAFDDMEMFSFSNQTALKGESIQFSTN